MNTSDKSKEHSAKKKVHSGSVEPEDSHNGSDRDSVNSGKETSKDKNVQKKNNSQTKTGGDSAKTSKETAKHKNDSARDNPKNSSGTSEPSKLKSKAHVPEKPESLFTPERNIPCDLCSEKFFNTGSLLKHKKNVHK